MVFFLNNMATIQGYIHNFTFVWVFAVNLITFFSVLIFLIKF